MRVGMMEKNRRRIGESYEKRAYDYLQEQGYRILECNYRCRSGEIDLIARDGAYLVFVEVKYRRDTTCGIPEEAVDKRKQRAISRVADYYCMKMGYTELTPCRFDVVAFLGDRVHLFQNAFLYVGRR